MSSFILIYQYRCCINTCVADHLWKQQAAGKATLSDLKELMKNADVAVLEIDKIDNRLVELTKLDKKWFDKLGDYLKNELTGEDHLMQVNNFDEKSKCRHLAIFRREADYSILIVLTVGEEQGDQSGKLGHLGNTKIRALIKDIPRRTADGADMTWEHIYQPHSSDRKFEKHSRNLRIEIENFMVSIALFLVKTMIDD